MNAESNLITVPLSQLRPCPNNVRKVGGASIEDLAASIKAHGLLQNLSVRKAGADYEVFAGARRLRALQLLDKGGELPAAIAASGVPCMVLEDGLAHEAGLAENVLREAMHPADEFAAFRDVIEKHKLTPAQVAARFGKTEKYVEQRLRLANVSPKLLDEYRAGKANLEQMMALAIVDDHAAQEKAWKAGEHNSYYRNPNQLRDALVEHDIELTQPLGAFVGVEAYEAAGGKPRRDLFSDFVTLPDSKLVQKLAKKKLENEAAKVKALGWGWVEVKPEFDYSERSKYRQANSTAPSEKLGAVVTIGRNGKAEVVAGLVKPGEKAPVGAGPKKAATSSRNDKLVTRESLVGIRNGILRSALAADQALALRALAAMLASGYWSLDGDDPISAVLYVELNHYSPPSQKEWTRVTCPGADAEAAAWEKRVRDGAKKSGSILAWLRSEPDSTVLKLLAFLVAGSISTDDFAGDEKQVHAAARDMGVDFAAAWTITVEWLAKQPKGYVLEAVTEAAGKEAAKALEKGKAKDLVSDAHAILVEKGWVPEALRDPAPPAKKAGKSSPAKATVTETPSAENAGKTVPAKKTAAAKPTPKSATAKKSGGVVAKKAAAKKSTKKTAKKGKR